MAIMTSRYGNKELRNDGYYPVGISLGKPKYQTGYEIREQCYALAPKGHMLKMAYEPYREAYFEKLEEIGADKIIGIVQRMDERAQEEGKTLVLLCFEDIRKPDQWCHRTLFAEWWQKMTGEVINELEEADVKPQKVETASAPQQSIINQMSLF
mgnify:FL=1